MREGIVNVKQKYFLLFYLRLFFKDVVQCVWMGVSRWECMYFIVVFGCPEVQRLSELPEMELRVVVSYLMWVLGQSSDSLEQQQVLLTTGHLQPLVLSLMGSFNTLLRLLFSCWAHTILLLYPFFLYLTDLRDDNLFKVIAETMYLILCTLYSHM